MNFMLLITVCGHNYNESIELGIICFCTLNEGVRKCVIGVHKYE